MRVVEEPDEPGVYTIQGISPLDGAITFGEGLERAKELAKDALSGVLASMLEHNEDVPRPSEAEGKDVVWIEPAPEVAAPILLRWARQEANLTQGELATRLGLTYQSVQRLERPGANPSIKTLARVARALGRELHIAI